MVNEWWSTLNINKPTKQTTRQTTKQTVKQTDNQMDKLWKLILSIFLHSPPLQVEFGEKGKLSFSHCKKIQDSIWVVNNQKFYVMLLFQKHNTHIKTL